MSRLRILMISIERELHSLSLLSHHCKIVISHVIFVKISSYYRRLLRQKIITLPGTKYRWVKITCDCRRLLPWAICFPLGTKHKGVIVACFTGSGTSTN